MARLVFICKHFIVTIAQFHGHWISFKPEKMEYLLRNNADEAEVLDLQNSGGGGINFQFRRGGNFESPFCLV